MPVTLHWPGESLGALFSSLTRRRLPRFRIKPLTDQDAVKGSAEPESADRAANAHPDTDSSPPAPWSDERIAFCKRLWGNDEEDDSLEPGGTAYYRELIQQAAISKSKSTLDLSAGLGGGLRHMADKLGLWMTGMETDPELVRLGMALSVKRKLKKQAPITLYDPATLTLPREKYHAVMMRERLHMVKDKAALLHTIRTCLKPDGYFVLTDYALPDGTDTPAKSVKDWLALLHQPATLATVSEYKQVLSQQGFKTRAFQDETAQYRAMILRGWARLMSELRRDELTQSFVATMLQEATYWVRLERALARGKLAYIQALCVAEKGDPVVS